MGKPGGMNSRYSRPNKIGRYELTQGSEPSQYLEEKKTIVIPSVAASERGSGQCLKSVESEPHGKAGMTGDSPVRRLTALGFE